MNTATILTVLFVILKVLGYIQWSWWLVFAPIYAPFIILLIILISSAFFFGD